jgi:hypothetical protein
VNQYPLEIHDDYHDVIHWHDGIHQNQLVRTAVPHPARIRHLSITMASAKFRTRKQEPFEYNEGWCIGMAFHWHGEISKHFTSSYTDGNYVRTLPNPF